MPTSSSTLDPANVEAIFKAYDVRGTVPDQLDEDLARATGAAFVEVIGAPTIVIGYDMRPSSPDLAGAFAQGATEAGADVVMIGLASTDQLYFASGQLGHAGVMFTASHNPAQYNGMKMCRAGATPIGTDTGLADIAASVIRGGHRPSAAVGSISQQDVLEAYAAHLLSLAPVAGRRLKVVVDAGNGMAGLTAPTVFERLGTDLVEVVPMYFELDGTFPNHEANPIEAANLVDLQKRVLDEGADIGLAFDGDADRCFLVDERGEAVSPSTLTALIAARELAKEPGSTIIHNLITSRAVPELVTELGGRPVRTRVGHSYIKATMAETGAIFGGEHSGHFYFRDFWKADSGMLAALHAPGRPGGDRPAAERAAGGVRALCRQRRDQLDRLRPGQHRRRPGDAVHRRRGRHHRPPRRAHREPRRLVVQRPPVQHRAAAATQRRGSRRATMQRVRDEILTIIRSAS